MNNTKTAIIVDNDRNMNRFISALLKNNHFQTISSYNGNDAISMIMSYVPDIIILETGLSDINGIDIIKKTRSWSNIPIIVVSAVTYEQDIVYALDSGADDYITKPFGTEELMARIRVALRKKGEKSHSLNTQNLKYHFDELYIDFSKHEILLSGKPIHLTNIEYKIIEQLCEHSGKIVTHDFLMNKIWGPYSKYDNKILRVNITNIRKKINDNPTNPKYIYTEQGVGYKIAETKA